VLNRLDGREAEHLVVDLTDVTLVDSSALLALVAAARTRGAAGQELVLVCDSPVTLRAFEIACVLPFFRVERSLREAINAAAATGPAA
jgi:anti-anti-sigma factor